jgi:flavin-dependent dehydrogenase
VRADVEGQFMTLLDGVPELAERVRGGRREERFYGATDLPNFLRTPYGPGWALVGDAGCHKDPFLALGVCDALRDVELLAEALDEGLSGRRPMAEAMAAFAERRDAATLPAYRENLAMAQFTAVPDDVFRLRAALRDDQAETNRFFMAREGMIPRESFFNGTNLQRLMARGAAAPE